MNEGYRAATTISKIRGKMKEGVDLKNAIFDHESAILMVGDKVPETKM